MEGCRWDRPLPPERKRALTFPKLFPSQLEGLDTLLQGTQVEAPAEGHGAVAALVGFPQGGRELPEGGVIGAEEPLWGDKAARRRRSGQPARQHLGRWQRELRFGEGGASSGCLGGPRLPWDLVQPLLLLSLPGRVVVRLKGDCSRGVWSYSRTCQTLLHQSACTGRVSHSGETPTRLTSKSPGLDQNKRAPPFPAGTVLHALKMKPANV